MKIDFTTVLRDFDGKEILENGDPITVHIIVNRSLVGVMPKNQGATLSPDESANVFRIATSIMKNPAETNLSHADIVLLDKAISQCMWPPLVYGQIKNILDGVPTGLEPNDEDNYTC